LERNDTKDLNVLAALCHYQSREAGWWETAPSDANRKFEIGTQFSLIHSEVSEAMEGFRRGAPDEHLPDRMAVEVELADTLIRIFDLAGALGLDLSGAVHEKFHYNAQRPDHKIENRAATGGKKF